MPSSSTKSKTYREVYHPEAVVFDFMQPQVAAGQLVGLCRKARRDEAGGEGTLQHAGLNKVVQRLLQRYV